MCVPSFDRLRHFAQGLTLSQQGLSKEQGREQGCSVPEWLLLLRSNAQCYLWHPRSGSDPS